MTSRVNFVPSLFLSNIQSLCSKLDELMVFAHSCSPDVIALTESWTNETVSDQQILIPGYSRPYRHDRSDGRKGGGVCCYVKSTISSLPIHAPFDCPSEIESVWLKFPVFKLVLAVLYVPPNLKIEIYKNVIDFVIKMSDWTTQDENLEKLVLAGDFNQLPTSEFESVLGLTQVVQEPTRGQAILDKIFLDTLSTTKYSLPIVGPNFGKADHKSVIMKPKSISHCTSRYVKVFDYRQSFLDKFSTKLAAVPWHLLYSLDADLQVKCNLFYQWFADCMKEIPYSFVEMKSTDKAWMTPLLKRLIELKHEAFRRKQFHIYTHYQHKLKFEISRAKADWVKRQKESPKKIWDIVKSISNKESTNLSSLSSIVSQFPNASHAADAINDKFAEVFTALPNWNKLSASFQDNDTWEVDTSVSTVFMELQKLDTKKSFGGDGVSPRLLKEGAPILAAPIAHLLSLSIHDSSVPLQWKSADIIPLPKSSTITLDNLRPISLLSCIAKILEKRVLESVKDKLISSYGLNQFGFRPKSGTLFALISLTDFVTSQLDLPDNVGVAVISFDMRRAFDRLPYDQLFRSLLDAKVPQCFLRWCMSYFYGRRQRVILEGSVSSSFVNVTSGVPQGSILSPYLFACHMGSLRAANANSKMIKYADDVALAVPYTSERNAESRLREELDSMEDWCRNRGLQLNQQKTKVMFINKKGHVEPKILHLQSADSLKILGVTLQKDLKWNSHIDIVCKAAAKRIYILKQLKRLPSMSKNDLVQIYSAHVQSLLEYNSVLFVGTTKENDKKVEKIMKRCHKVICNLDCKCDLLPSPSKRRVTQALSVLKKIMHPDHILHDIAPSILAHSKHLQINYRKTDRRAKSFIPFTAKLYNQSLSK